MKTTINMAVIENLLKDKGYSSQYNEAGQYVKIILPDNDYWGQGHVHYEINKSNNCFQLSFDVEGKFAKNKTVLEFIESAFKMEKLFKDKISANYGIRFIMKTMKKDSTENELVDSIIELIKNTKIYTTNLKI